MHLRDLTPVELADLLDSILTGHQALTERTFNLADIIENDQVDS
jgi:hypothetical protein